MLALCRVRLGIGVGSRFINNDRVVKELENNEEQGGETVPPFLHVICTDILAVSPRSHPTYASFLTISMSSPSSSEE